MSCLFCSYGVVHLCIDKATGQKKAAKIMPKVRAKQTLERTQKKLEREVALMTRISRESRAVAQLVDVFEDRSYVYIVMDLLEGGDLEQLLEVSMSQSSSSTSMILLGVPVLGTACYGLMYLAMSLCRPMEHSQKKLQLSPFTSA